jgi:uncharacterized protein (DUF849 family)
MDDPFIVMCAPNGARKTKDDHPALPMRAGELADCAASIAEAGASIIHAHVRDENGGHSLDVDRYRDAVAAIRDRVGDRLVIQVTTEACGVYSPLQQMAMVRELRPEAVSVALREFNPDEDRDAADFYAWLAGEGIFAQHILYSPDEVRRFESLRESGVIPDTHPFVLFVLGRYTSDLQGDVTELPAYVEAARPDTTWAVCSFGNTEHEAAAFAASNGGHIRVGFENNLLMPDGSVAESNDLLVGVAASIAGGRPVATADDVRSMFAIGAP